jgi:hypothetical protein
MTNEADITKKKKIKIKNTDTTIPTELEISIAGTRKSLPYYLDHKTCLGS